MMSGYHTFGDLIHDSLKGFSVHVRILGMNSINVIAVFNQKHNAFNRNTGSLYDRRAAHNVLIDSDVFAHLTVELSKQAMKSQLALKLMGAMWYPFSWKQA